MINQSQSGLSSSEEQEEENQLNQKLLQNYWKIKESIRKKEPQSNKYSMGSVEKAIEQEEQKNLETRMLLTQQQYSKARENNILLLKKLSEAEEYTQFLKFQLDKLKRQKSEELSAMTEIIDKLQLQLQTNNAQKLKLSRDSNNNQVNALQKVIQNKEKDISRLSLKIKSLQLALQEKETSLQQCTREIQYLSLNLERMKENDVDQSCLQINGSEILELQQAKAAIDRLFSLLKNTEEYKSFFNYSKNCQDLTFLSEAVKFMPQKTEFGWKMTQKMKQGGIDQKMVWTPSNCYKAMLAIKGKYHQLSQSCIQEILFQLNRLYLQREQDHVNKLKEQYSAQLHKIKTKNLQKYDEVVARKQIQRLKKELQQTRFNKTGPTEELNLLKTIGDYEDQLRLKERENRLLSERLQLLESQNLNYDKTLYLEGALWLIDKVLDEVSQFQENFNYTVQGLQARTREKGQDNDEILINEISESFSQLLTALHQKLLSMKESTLKKVNSQKKYQDTDRTQ